MNHLANCTNKECPKYKYCKRYSDNPDRPMFNFKWLFKNRGFKCFVYKEREKV